MLTTILLTLILNLTLTAPENLRATIPAGRELSDALTWDNIRAEMLKYGILFPDTVMRQVKLESAYLTSRLCLEANNLLGMHYPKKRNTTATGKVKSNGMAVYDTWQDCIRDYKLWETYMYKGGDYLDLLSRVYATDPYYLSKLKRL